MSVITRRAMLAATAAGITAARFGAPAHAQGAPAPATLGEDGLYHFDWYVDSFLDLAEDIATARGKGKRLAVLWSQRGCIYCKRMALEHFAQGDIVDYVRAHFDVLHFDLFGARETTDFDGAKRSEKALAAQYGIRLTPTFQFFPESADGLAAKTPQAREVARMPGLLEPKPFLQMFRFVAEKGYETMSFADWVRTRA